MQDRDRRDIVGGLLLAAIGIVAGLYALANYRMGTVNRMGPGMVPVTMSMPHLPMPSRKCSPSSTRRSSLRRAGRVDSRPNRGRSCKAPPRIL